MADLEKKTEEIAEAVTGGFQKIEDGVVGGYLGKPMVQFLDS